MQQRVYDIQKRVMENVQDDALQRDIDQLRSELPPIARKTFDDSLVNLTITAAIVKNTRVAQRPLPKMDTALILPGYDTATGNRNSFLWRTYPEYATEYTPTQPLEDKPDARLAIVHSYGFFAFLAGYQQGLYRSVKRLVVFDGYYPAHLMFADHKVELVLPPIECIFFFPTVGNRTSYPLRSLLVTDEHTVVTGEGFGHNLLYNEFTTKEAEILVDSVVRTYPGEKYKVVFPHTQLTNL